MTIHSTGPLSVALYIDAGELTLWDSRWEMRIDSRWARQLVCDAFSGLGLPAQGDMEVEAIAGAAGVLVFASLLPHRARAPLFCRFRLLDDLLAALQALPVLPPLGQVVYYQDEYILFFLCSPAQCVVVSETLTEYGQLSSHHAAFALFLQDQGRMIAKGHQLYTLRELV